MALSITNVERIFKFKDQILEDIDSSMSYKEIQAHYSAIHPELTTAKVVGPIVDKETGVVSYKFETNLGTKG